MKLLITGRTVSVGSTVVRSIIHNTLYHETTLGKLTDNWGFLGVISGVVKIEKVVK